MSQHYFASNLINDMKFLIPVYDHLNYNLSLFKTKCFSGISFCEMASVMHVCLGFIRL